MYHLMRVIVEVRLSSPSKGKSKKSSAASVGLQPYKLIYDIERSEQIDQTSVRETFFFVVPSTSGRVVSHQLPDKVKLFRWSKGCRGELQTIKNQFQSDGSDNITHREYKCALNSTNPFLRVGFQNSVCVSKSRILRWWGGT